MGVDVFFVISGFLITSHLIKELQATGHIQLPRFYARRIKRLLPAAFTVLAASGIGVIALMPWDRWQINFQEIAAAGAYIHNLLLAVNSVDYHAAGQGASVVQHYWSLSVEEQFYLLWPALLLGFFVVTGRVISRRKLMVGLAVFGGIFFAFNVWFTAAYLRPAYFFTPVRFWEFAAGAMVTVALPWLKRSLGLPGVRPWAAVTAGIAWVSLTLTTFLLTPVQPFPGWWALAPVLATSALIALGTGGELPVIGRITSLRPVQFLGDASYSIYLWHWPLIILAPYALRYAPRYPEKLALLALTIGLAAVSKRWIEDPGQRIKWPTLRVMTTMAGAVASCAVLCWGAIAHANSAQERFEAAEDAFLAGECAGPRALLEPECSAQVNAPLFKTFLGKRAEYYGVPAGCILLEKEEGALPRLLECDHSGGNANAELVYLVGDSHAQQWQHVVNAIAAREGWKLRLLFKGGCAIGNLPLRLDDAAAEQQCAATQTAALEHLDRVRPDHVIYSTFAVRWKVDDGTGRSQTEQYADGLAPVFKQWADNGAKVTVIADSPLNGAVRQVECAAVNVENPAQCAVAREVAVPATPLTAAVEKTDSPQVALLDLTDAFCDDEVCYQSVGGVLVYFDYDHLQRQYTDQLLEPFARRLVEAHTKG